VTLRPRIDFEASRAATPEELRRMHDEAHHECFIANSVRCSITVE
jgi:organic hydroperoxide reductase OsmC/OhrA